ncbi:hypothetical protein [Marinicella litoralis]|uniref:D-alanine transfer protein n=1 Tax=Marinicella litoralis TaxID=644220 RepID=A0A4R6Y3B7_9GAMM|nr:hypothetical protein [Marinicella litoralis]TDR23538.1 hypothetical protein C8D91_0401 [Marinicella litoralis]
MPSSTSNSDTVNPTTERRIYGKTLLVILLGMTAALGLVKAFAYANDASSETILGRVLEAKAALPQILQEPEELVMVFGSSMVHAGFSPREFDQHMRDAGIENTQSFNFGFGGLNPFFQDIFTRRIREAFEAENRRLKLAVIEFNPFQTTITRHQGALALEDSFITMLGSEAEFREILLDDPTRGVRLYNIKYLRDSISAEMITNFFSRGFQEPRQRSELKRDQAMAEKLEAVGEKLNTAFEQDYPDFQGAQWSYQWQGGGTIPAERSAETLALFDEYYALSMDPARLDDDRLNRIHTADIIEMHFSDELVEAFIRLVNQFKTFSDHVEVVMLPRNTDWIIYTEGGQQRLDAAIKRIEQGTGLKIKNHQDLPVMKPHMFADTTHLNRYQGASTYTRYLAQEYQYYLRN